MNLRGQIAKGMAKLVVLLPITQEKESKTWCLTCPVGESLIWLQYPATLKEYLDFACVSEGPRE